MFSNVAGPAEPANPPACQPELKEAAVERQFFMVPSNRPMMPPTWSLPSTTPDVKHASMVVLFLAQPTIMPAFLLLPQSATLASTTRRFLIVAPSVSPKRPAGLPPAMRSPLMACPAPSSVPVKVEMGVHCSLRVISFVRTYDPAKSLAIAFRPASSVI